MKRLGPWVCLCVAGCPTAPGVGPPGQLDTANDGMSSDASLSGSMDSESSDGSMRPSGPETGSPGTEGNPTTADASATTGGPATTDPDTSATIGDPATTDPDTSATIDPDPTDPVPDPTDGSDPPFEVCNADGGCLPAHAVYLNFDAEGTFTFDTTQVEDATLDRHALDPALVGSNLPGFGGSATERADLLAAVQEKFEGYGVVVTDTRPMNTDYSMVVFTQNPGTDLGAVNEARIDCNDAVPNSLSFVYVQAGNPLGGVAVANLVAQTIAFGIGLEQTASSAFDDLMRTDFQVGEFYFSNECRELEADPPACPLQHQVRCPAGQQWAHIELETTFGFLGSI